MEWLLHWNSHTIKQDTQLVSSQSYGIVLAEEMWYQTNRVQEKGVLFVHNNVTGLLYSTSY